MIEWLLASLNTHIELYVDVYVHLFLSDFVSSSCSLFICSDVNLFPFLCYIRSIAVTTTALLLGISD